MSVGVILLNWNTSDLTAACVKSILNGKIQPSEILIIDNGSENEPLKALLQLSQEHPCINLLRNERNMGFAAGNNIGITYFIRKGVDYIWILNNDTVVDQYCLHYLLKEFANKENVYAVTGKILYPPPDKRIWYAGAKFNKLLLKVYHRGALKKDFGQYEKSEDVLFISGCCMLAKREAFEKIGLFDEKFFAYSEDLDWCLRARKNGLTLCYVPKAIVYHRVSASLHKNRGKISGGTSSPFGIYLTTRNRFYIVRKHASNLIHYLIAIAAAIIERLIYGAGLTLLGRDDKLKAVLKGLKDGCLSELKEQKPPVVSPKKPLS